MKIKYEFIFEDNRLEVFILNFNDTTLNLESFPVEITEPWTKLEFNQCKVCTLKTSVHKYCPVARNLSYVFLQFKDDTSHEKVKIQVTTERRSTEKHASLQEGLSTLMGLIMATSGCPILDKFKPMAFVHLPFSGEIETIFRAISMYITAQYVRMENGLEPDWHLKKFRDMYAVVNQINYDFAERVKLIKGRDANMNALILLDLFAQAGSLSFSEKWMKELEPLFSAYLKE